ncbi:putative cyclin-a3-1 [Phtheirospermum japonicum]|uniref:Putative cyclin-a3-1 n=1 Tax=Phtheirospermum japonicum TaxID=374723 RepID=A0A830BXP9_9LAMI|nr:putative cyclin-a3-1 [Phtheirospermum japonicum]
MADLENQIPTKNKGQRKRSNQSPDSNPAKKKRVALGELTNISSDISGRAQNLGVGKIRRPKPETLSEKTGNEMNLELAVSPGSDEPRKSGYAAASIFQHLHSIEVEAKRRPLSNYMEKVQEDINPAMRTILVDWLVEVAEEYKLVSDTLYLTVNYIDRYLSAYKLIRNKLQLLGVSCMLVASKYEEITPPHIEDFCYITDNTYTKDEVVHMERDVLKFLGFEMSNPTTKTFLRAHWFYCCFQFSNIRFEFLCYYIAELSLTDYGCVRYIPSIVAASAIFLARLTMQPKSHPWTLALQKHTGYKPYELKECVLRLHNLLLTGETSARAVRQKYMDHKVISYILLCFSNLISDV